MSEFYGVEQSKELEKRLEDGSYWEGQKEPMSDEESVVVQAKKQALDQLFGQRPLHALYKIEMQFGKERSTWKPFAGAMTLYLSGTKLHGGGDEKLYFCPRDDCDGIVYPKERLGPSVRCRSCDMMWNEAGLVGEIFYRLTPQDWAQVILKTFARLDHHADIYVKYHPTDIRYQSQMELARARGGEEIAKARKNRGLHIYPLRNIIKDTSNGADLYKRILTFITA